VAGETLGPAGVTDSEDTALGEEAAAARVRGVREPGARESGQGRARNTLPTTRRPINWPNGW